MDPLEKALKGLEAQTLEELLSRLAELQALRAKGTPVTAPRVTLHLRSGRELQGFLLELRNGGKSVVLHALSADARRSEPDAIFIRTDSIEALTVHELPSLYQLPRDTPPPPSRLVMKRKLAERQTSLASALGAPVEVEVDWDRLPPEPEALAAIEALSSRALGVLEDLTRELMALEALRANVRKVRLLVGLSAQVTRQDHSLLLVTTVSPIGWMSREDLHHAIEKVL
ncbi:hypothetical protein [Hyalangium rubrum]|uniref:Uncharacterized protein n=1 Tax=Hyalangium rubrum TaxID=3103134 RepID=A0ABU5GWT0_9BACT|nr:hypothetical protein [Hyalangium sp. s54d21]MDY7225648.1 hypothetical protein [Hyalangium sp. s54d21]